MKRATGRDRTCITIAILLFATFTISTASISLSMQLTYAAIEDGAQLRSSTKAPIAVSGNNVCVTWWSNKTGDWEVFFKASADSGKTFSPKLDLSNSKGVVSNDASIAASGNNVYVSWWERTDKSDEPVMKVSNDNGKTFGEKIMLSNNATTAKPLL
jgi:hypothetical protein